MASSTALPALQSSILQSPLIKHAFYTREGGVSTNAFASLNVSLSQDDSVTVLQNRHLIALHLGTIPSRLFFPSLAHGSSVKVFAHGDPSPHDCTQPADGVVTNRRGLAIAAYSADCAPVLFSDVEARVVGAAHAGWKGALAGVLDNVVEEMCALGATARRIRAAVGPCIQQQSYEVGDEFQQRFVDDDASNESFFTTRYGKHGKVHFDVPAYCKYRLEKCGVASEHIDLSDVCTREDSRFFSARRNNHQGVKGWGCQASAIVLL